MIFRRAIPSDLEELVRLRQLFVSEANNGKPVPALFADATRNYFSQNLLRPDALVCWVASTGSALAATASLIRFQRMPSMNNPNGAEGYISNVYTELGHRRKGLATSLMESLVRDSVAQGINRLWLYSRDDGYGIYKKLGFEPKRRKEIEMQLLLGNSN